MASPLDWLQQVLGGTMGEMPTTAPRVPDALSQLGGYLENSAHNFSRIPADVGRQVALPYLQNQEKLYTTDWSQKRLVFDPQTGEPGRIPAFASWMMEGLVGGAPGGAGVMSSGARWGGPPIRAYHYSPNEFAKFDMAKAGSVTDPGLMGRALYFSTDPAVAKAGPHRYEVDLNMRSPLQVEHAAGKTKTDLVGSALDVPPPVAGALTVGKASPNLPAWQKWSEDIAGAAKGRGHDAAVMDYGPSGYKHKEIAVYDPSIIEILRKYGLLPPLAAGGLLGAAQGDEAAY
jgi:hypothetical protein